MSKYPTTLFKKSLIAAAVLSVSACSTVPSVPSVDLGSVGSGLANAGKATIDAGRKTWNTTTYLLGFTDSIGPENTTANTDDALLANATGIAPANSTQSAAIVQPVNVEQPVVIQQASAPLDQERLQAQTLPQQASPADQDLSQALLAQQSLPQALPTDQNNAALADLSSAQPAIEDLSSENLSNENLVTEDLIHKVSDNETLWDIAKKTTGDANNWHILAEVNDLTQSAVVFPGQQLVIPSDLVKPDFDTPETMAGGVSAIAAQTTQELDPTTRSAALVEADQLALGAPAPIAADPAAAVVQSTQPTSSAALTQVTDTEAERATIAINASPVDLNEGETLWDFAKRTTGDATNWQAIAAQNNFTEKQAVTVRPGQTIFVPHALIKGEDSASNAVEPANSQLQSASVSEAEPVLSEPSSLDGEQIAASQTQNTASETQIKFSEQLVIPYADEQGDSQAMQASLNQDQPQTMQIVEATYKTDMPLIDTDANPELLADAAEQNIMVSGTYYPKAVYNSADFSSSLLMRVSPGTTLQVSRTMGSWFEVETDKGIGYVHARDIK